MEGCDGDAEGRPGKLTIRRYDRFAAGGAGLIWLEATAVVPEGRANPRQLWLNEKSKESFAGLVARMRQVAAERYGTEHRPLLVLQLTHSGRYSKPTGSPHPLIPQHDPYRDNRMNLPNDWPVVTDEYLDQLQEAYLSAARSAFEVGFDAVDVKACHGYLINELLAGHLREGKYGGHFENRTRFLLEVIDRIRSELGEDKMVATRLGIFDGIPYPYGWGVDEKNGNEPDLNEPKRLVSLLASRRVPLVNISVGNPYYNPHYGRPYNEPTAGGSESSEHPLVGVSRMIGLAGEIQKRFPEIRVVGTGYSWLRTLLPQVAAGAKTQGLASFIGAGRMALAYPDFARDILQKGGMDPEKVCIACSSCTQIMRDGGRSGCVVRDNDIYGPIYEEGRLRNRDNLVRLAEACRQCQEPTCRLACPAGVDIPRFVELFLEGDLKRAFEVIRQSNLLPEVCARLCPVENQCEGGCLQRYIGDRPVPIAAIQRYIAEKANLEGWSKLHVPEESTGKRVAVLGAGPAGLACAGKLVEMGYNVTLFEGDPKSGGMIESVIPSERAEDSLTREVEAIFKEVPKERLTWRRKVPLNEKANLDTLMAEGFDAAFVALGLSEAAGESKEILKGLYNALDFLRQVKEGDCLDVEGKRMAVIGGGNTALDAATAAKGLGARDVYLIYRRSFREMPAWPGEWQAALKKGVHFIILTQKLGYMSKEGKVTGLLLCPTTLGEPDSSGRRRPIPQEDNSYTLAVDLVVEAIGQKAPANLKDILPGVALKGGLVEVKDSSSATSRRAVFAGGDIVRGPSTVVAAVSDGMKAAQNIDRFLKE